MALSKLPLGQCNRLDMSYWPGNSATLDIDYSFRLTNRLRQHTQHEKDTVSTRGVISQLDRTVTVMPVDSIHSPSQGQCDKTKERRDKRQQPHAGKNCAVFKQWHIMCILNVYATWNIKYCVPIYITCLINYIRKQCYPMQSSNAFPCNTAKEWTLNKKTYVVTILL